MASKRHRDQATLPPEFVANIEPAIIRDISAELRSRGIEQRRAFDGTGLQAEHLDSDELRMSYRQTSQVIRQAMRLLDDPHLGLRLGAHSNLVSWGTAYLGILASANSHEMLEFAADFLPSGTGLLDLRTEDLMHGPGIVAHARFDEPVVASFLVENAFAAITHACRSVLGSSYGPVSVELTISRPSSSQVHRELFACPVCFARSENRMQFAREAVANPLADAIVFRRVRKAMAQERDSTVRSHELEVSILRALRGRFDAPPRLAEIASTLHLSERTLRRRLAELGLRYADLLDRERRRRALALIRSGEHVLNQVAMDTGFANVRSLRRAVRRWTGQSPSALKRGK